MNLENILSQMANYTTDSILVTKRAAIGSNQNIEIVYVNKSFTDLTGYTFDEVVGKSPRFLRGPKTDMETISKLRIAIQNNKPATAEILNYSKDGCEYWVEVNLTPIFSKDTNECLYYLAAERDITERKNAESQLIKAIEKAEAATDAKSDFLANMSHELRTPMNGILGLAEILQGMDLNEEVRECVDAIGTSGRSLLFILNDILDLSKIEAEELAIEIYPFRTHEILKNIKDLTVFGAAGKNLDYNIQVNMNVPEWLKGDGKRIQQVMFNLIGNAIKFTEKGSVTLSVDWKIVDKKSHLIIQVQDTGIGIPDEFHNELFNKFSQADTSISRKFGGTGLGLAITKYLVDMMFGTIHCTSKLNHGTTFYVEIPLEQASDRDVYNTDISVVNENSLQGINLQNIRALIVEDHPINQMLGIKWLKKLGIKQIDSALNGFESLTLLRNNAYDFILMDCQMPELDGYETTSLIRDMEKQINHRTPIIAMTANAMLGEREKCLNSGMDDYLSKPLQYSEFQSCIARWIGAKPHSIEDTKTSVIDESVPLDLTRLNEFTEGDKDTERMVINLFLETAYQSFDSLKTAQISESADDWSQAAHGFKGASGNLGAMTLHKLCSDAEYKGELPADEKAAMLVQLYSEFTRIEEYLKTMN